MPSASYDTRTWPSHPVPAPSPIVGIETAAELVVALRGQADVAHHRDAGGDQPLDELGVDRTALELDRVAAALLHQLAGVADALLDRCLVRHERHVADDMCTPGTARYRTAVVRDLVERHRQGGVVALDDHAERVAHEEHVRAGLVEQPREGRVVGREHRDLLAPSLHLPEGVDGDLRGLHSARPFSDGYAAWESRAAPARLRASWLPPRVIAQAARRWACERMVERRVGSAAPPAWDVAVIGGGPSGISTALHLQAAAPAARIVVLEKERYPRDKICAGGIGARAFRLLEAIGVEVACPHVALDAVALRVAGETVVIREPGCGAVVRRIEFDHAFAREAIARGITVRDGCAVGAIAVDERGTTVTTDGATLHARCVVGADGVGGIVRRQAGFARGELRAQVVELDTEGAPGDLPRDTIVFDFSTRELRGYAWDFPTLVGDRPLVCRGVYVLGVATDHPRTRLTAYLAARGLDLARYRVKQFAERGFEPGAELARPRVLLVGEAAGIDIATGEGIGQAIEYGAVAARYLAQALADDDLGFRDWRRVIDRHHLGLQLRIRHAAHRAFYGRGRATVERMLPRLPALIRAGVQDFAGVPISGLGVVRGVGQLIAAAVRAVR
jgi:flavin-dependent dehydrogenase